LNPKKSIESHYTSFTNLGIKPNIYFKIVYFLASLLFNIINITSFILFLVKYKRFICFLYFQPDDSHDNIVFQTNLISVCFIVSILILLNTVFQIYNCINDEDITTDIYKNIDYFYIIGILLSISGVMTGTIINSRLPSLICVSILNSLSIVFLLPGYFKLKSRKDMSISSYLSFYINSSCLLSFVTYIAICGYANIICFGDSSSYLKGLIAICCNIIYCLISVVLLTYFKDLFFSFVYIIIQIGYIFCNILKEDRISSYVLLGFLFVGIALTIFKHKKNAFGFSEQEDTNDILYHHKMENENI